MRKILFSLLAACLIPASGSWALFTNGGFETGDTTGWTVTGYADYGGPQASVIDSTGNMSYQATDINPYNGNYMVRIGDVDGWWYNREWTQISQSDTIQQSDIDNGATLYVNWGAVLVDPINPHGPAAEPFFNIDVWVGSSKEETFTAVSSARSSDPNWTNAGTFWDGSGLWYYQDTWSFDLSNYLVGDTVLISMYVTDCDWGGHGGYAFLDGIGTIYQPPVVPEPSTIALLGAGLVGLVAIRRKKRTAA